MKKSTIDKSGVPVENLKLVVDLREKHERQLTVPYKVMSWPIIYDHLNVRGSQFAQDIRDIFSRGSPWFVEQSKWTSVTSNPTLRQAPSASSISPVPAKARTTCLLHQYGEVTIKGYVEAYSCTFNKVRPILEQEFFTREAELQSTNPAPLGREIEAVLLLLVIALGELVHR
jgi:hypothetical protein